MLGSKKLVTCTRSTDQITNNIRVNDVATQKEDKLTPPIAMIDININQFTCALLLLCRYEVIQVPLQGPEKKNRVNKVSLARQLGGKRRGSQPAKRERPSSPSSILCHPI
jgi:hypothetical protein